jgi:hypothetical protein
VGARGLYPVTCRGPERRLIDVELVEQNMRSHAGAVGGSTRRM